MTNDPMANLKAAALTDINFRRQVIANPSAALQSMNIPPTQEILAAIQKVIQDLEALGQLLGIDDIALFS